MATDSLIESERVRASRAVSVQRLLPRERRAELLLGGAFLAAAVTMVGVAGVHRHVSLAMTVMFVLAMAAAAQMYFEVGASFTVPTQLVFVPMLFAEPPALVPLLVTTALMLGLVPAIVRRRVPPGRLLHGLGNSWFSIGPALVLTVAGDRRPEAHAGILLFALGTQFLFDFGANLVRERLHGPLPLSDLVQEMWRVYLLDASLSPVGLAVVFAGERHGWSLLLVAPLLGLLSVFGRERRNRLAQLIELNDAYRGTALVLGDVVEADDTYTGEHTRGVVQLTLEVADRLRLDAHRRRNVEFGALLHDVGKVAVPKSIINKPGKLNDEEWAIIKQHTIEGQRMLETVGGFMKEVGRIVRSSHERWDGGGYPDGLVGEAIPLESRICAACDAYNAMTTTRSYRPAMPMAQAKVELERCAGSQFDPAVVQALVAVVERAAALSPAVAQPEPASQLPAAAAPSPGVAESPAVAESLRAAHSPALIEGAELAACAQDAEAAPDPCRAANSSLTPGRSGALARTG